MEIRKKIAFITALSLSVTLLAGCGPLDGDGMERENVSEVTEEIVADITETTEETGEEAEVTEITEVSETTESTSSVIETAGNKDETDYEKALRYFFEAENNCDYEAFLNFMYPSKIVGYMKSISGITAEAMAEQLGKSNVHYEVTDMITEGEISAEDLETLTLGYDAMYGLYSKLENEGKTIEDLTDEERMEYSEIFYSDPENLNYPKVFKATKGYDVTVHYLDDGEPDEDYFYVYYIEGDGWKLTNTMRKFMKNAMQNSLNANAKSLFTAAQTALADAEEDGTNLSGTYIISSDPSKNVNVPSGLDTETFCDTVTNKMYISEDDKYDYFVLVKDGVCQYCAIHKNADGYGVGVYPMLTIPVAFNGKPLEKKSVDRLDGYTIDELYDTCVELTK